MKRIILLFALLTLSFAGAIAQKTGLYTETRQFMGESRAFSIYAPTNYSPDSTYRVMICLHGSGDNSSNFLGVLIQQVKWNTLFPNTIFIAPDGGSDQVSDFFWPAGDEAVVDTALALIKSIYPNTGDVVLEGFSLGGRSALKIGLEHPEKYKGLILHTPAIQGPKEVLDIDPWTLHYKWENANKIPISITCGTQDAYSLILPKILVKLVKNDGIVDYHTLNMGHTIPPNTMTQQMMDFIYNPKVEGLDIRIAAFEKDFYTYGSEYKLHVPFWNRGTEDVESIAFTITPKSGGEPIQGMSTHNFKGYDYEEIETPALTLTPGKNEFEIKITKINGQVPENAELTAPVTFTINYLAPRALPVSQDFEGEEFPSDDWRIETSGSLIGWEVGEAGNGKKAAGIINTILTFDNQGLAESLISPVLKLNSVENPAVDFDYQFNYHYFDGTKTQGSAKLSDTLVISVSTDLGATWTETYRNAGQNLATFDEPILNPVQFDQTYFEPQADKWKKILIDLNDYKTSGNALVKFSIVSGVGGCFYINNVRFDDRSILGIEDRAGALSIAKLSPNPAVDATELSFSLANGGATRIEVVDMQGSVAARYDAGTLNHGENSLKLNTSALSPGLYFVKVLCGTETITAKLNVIGK